MTIKESSNGAGPGIHALVVGAAIYDHLTQPRAPAPARRLLDDLAQLPPLTVPGPSADAISQWLEKAGAQSVETLWPGSATSSEFVTAFDQWRRRCDSHPENVALFFFCGHGWSAPEQLLLFEDLGSRPEALASACVDVADMRAAMRGCAATTQVFFIDACRRMPPEITRIVTDQTVPLGGTRPQLPLSPIDSFTYFSTPLGSVAHGTTGQATAYTRAVVRMLDGLGARRDPNGDWTVRNGRFGADLQDVLAWYRDDGDPEQKVSVHCADSPGDGVLRRLDQPPTVPVRVVCEPPQALGRISRAQAHAADDPGQPCTDLPGGAGEIRVGIYKLDMTFQEDSGYRDVDGLHAAGTPTSTWQILVGSR